MVTVQMLGSWLTFMTLRCSVVTFAPFFLLICSKKHLLRKLGLLNNLTIHLTTRGLLNDHVKKIVIKLGPPPLANTMTYNGNAGPNYHHLPTCCLSIMPHSPLSSSSPPISHPPPPPPFNSPSSRPSWCNILKRRFFFSFRKGQEADANAPWPCMTRKRMA